MEHSSEIAEMAVAELGRRCRAADGFPAEFGVTAQAIGVEPQSAVGTFDQYIPSRRERGIGRENDVGRDFAPAADEELGCGGPGVRNIRRIGSHMKDRADQCAHQIQTDRAQLTQDAVLGRLTVSKMYPDQPDLP